MQKAGQYYNFTKSYLLPDLDDFNMSCRDKLIFLQQQINLSYYDDDIYNLYQTLLKLMNNKIQTNNYIMQKNSQLNTLFPIINNTNLKYLYNNLTKSDEKYIETIFKTYYAKKLSQSIITNTQIYLNSVERFNQSADFTNKIIPYQYYNNIICGLQAYTFSLHPNEYQPSGHANLYMFTTEIQLSIDTSMQNINSNEVIMIYIMGRSYNIMRHMGGIGGLAW
jgi:hypothetical protein